ncbi:S-adenosyl-L-methionine-dependent methyltransferase [Crepidotus variabilis]|uniref:S-adenosyl-L-methionine-dependent methyltransferase n=1 Tax=Crepidotus variabilis TaxID=179855 RepID=A0A9P6ET92_9AGAR|nr:S-adenosyl-L-methionine-dependent methyltransferase [Crepidotus variabilis]
MSIQSVHNPQITGLSSAPSHRSQGQAKKGPEDGDQRDASGWSASMYNKTASFVYSSEFTAPILTMLDARPGEKVLDVGCGSGEVTLAIQGVVEKGEGGFIVGTDASDSMIEKAKKNGLQHAFVADAQTLELPVDIKDKVDGGFDAVFSNATLHWCKRNPAGVLDSVKKVLKPGGRFVAEMGGYMNCIGVRSAIHRALRARGYNPQELDPWYFPSVEEYSKLLESAGFKITHILLNPRVTPLEAGVDGWLNLFVRGSFLKNLSDREAAEVIKEVVDEVQVDCQDADGKWSMMYTRLRFSAVLKN